MQNTQMLTKNSEYKYLYSRGKSAVTPFLAMYCKKSKFSFNRLGITVSTKVGKAVVRNKVRRRIREAYRINESLFKPAFDIVIVSRVRAAGASFHDIEASVLELGKRLGLLEDENK